MYNSTRYEELILEEAKRRRKIFDNLQFFLKKLVKTVRKLDTNAEVYLFGSVAEGRYCYGSDIDILIITEKNPHEIRSKLTELGFREPFELHVLKPEEASSLTLRSRLVNLKEKLGD